LTIRSPLAVRGSAAVAALRLTCRILGADVVDSSNLARWMSSYIKVFSARGGRASLSLNPAGSVDSG